MRPAVIPASVAAALGLYQLADPSIWVDEGYTARATGFDYVRLTQELHWVYYTTMKPWAAAAGTSEFALRLPSVVAAVAAVVLLYGLATRLAGARVGFVAALLLAINPFVVQWSQQARSYTFLAALAIASTWLLLRAIEIDVWTAWASYAFATIAVIHLHFFSAALLGPVHLVFAYRSRRAWVSWGVLSVVSIPWVLRMLNRGEEGSPVDWLERPTLSEIAGAAFVSGAFGAGLTLAIIGLRFTDHRRLLGAWAFLPAVLALVGSAWKPMFLDRYLIVSTPAFAILVAVALIALPRRAQLATAGVVVAGTALGLGHWYGPNGADNWKGENWRAAADYALARGGAQVHPEWAEMAYTYYGGEVVRTGLVIERVERTSAFVPGVTVEAHFGSRLRIVRDPGWHANTPWRSSIARVVPP